MARDETRTHMVGLGHGNVDVESVRAAIAKISGVSKVEFNYLTHKLVILYDGEKQTLREIEERLASFARPNKRQAKTR